MSTQPPMSWGQPPPSSGPPAGWGPAPGPPQPGPPPYGTNASPPPSQLSTRPMTVVTTESIAGRQLSAALGQVIGIAVRQREIGRREDPTIAYPALVLRSRQEAVAHLIDQARELGADAVVGLRFDSSEITQDLSEITAYGTAVRLMP